MKLKKISLKIANSTNDVAIKKIKSGLCSGIVISQKQKILWDIAGNYAA